MVMLQSVMKREKKFCEIDTWKGSKKRKFFETFCGDKSQ
jgi:hypothetical protein